jgi:hypothetical protein
VGIFAGYPGDESVWPTALCSLDEVPTPQIRHIEFLQTYEISYKMTLTNKHSRKKFSATAITFSSVKSTERIVSERIVFILLAFK